ncbi:Aspercryptin biosynthesis cluster-specific transcription regulator atnN [Fusarium oxysporum f. sp. albedinis]|nr:Aspercryptin biosynthesis cluster-specific transcription regulator atnN [Fusarium oxysporum f. sp. albedinis]
MSFWLHGIDEKVETILLGTTNGGTWFADHHPRIRNADHLQISDQDVTNNAKSAKFMRRQQGTRDERTLNSGPGRFNGRELIKCSRRLVIMLCKRSDVKSLSLNIINWQKWCFS